MNEQSLNFLKAMIETPSPSGFEWPVRKLYADYIKPYCDEVKHDVMGNVIGVINPDAKLRVMLSGHCDEIGLMITNITGDGFASFGTIGGFDASVLIGQRVWIHNERGKVLGVVGRAPIHLLRALTDNPQTPKIHEFWIDLGAKNKKDAEKVIAVGDCITIEGGFGMLRNDLAVGRGFDDRIGSWACAEALRLLWPQRKKLKVGVYAVASTQEELGMRGARTAAHGINPQAGIAVDVGFSSDYPTINKGLVGDISLNKGPILAKGANINSVLGNMILKAAKAKKIPYQIQAAPGATGTDANVIQMTRAGVAAALISVPNRYMHTPVEVISLKDLENTGKLLAETLLLMKANEDFIPMS